MPEKELTLGERERTLRIGRREFSRQAVVAILSAATITIVDCGGSSSPAPSPSPPPGGGGGGGGGDVAGAVSGNHGHVAVVTAAQITAANSVTLDITGTASHPHSLELSASEVGMIGQRQTVSKVSSNDSGHMHTVTFN
jgi:hypothetical protein